MSDPDTNDRPGRTSARHPRSYAVIGLGAIGGYYGTQLAAAGHPVLFVGRSDADHVRRHGLRVDSPRGDLHLATVDIVTGDELTRGADALGAAIDLPVDVVVVAVKNTDTASITPLFDHLVGPDTIVVTLQNGLGVEDTIARAAPGATVVGGMCFICSHKAGPGHIRHLDYGAVTFGEHTTDPAGAGVTDAVNAVADDFEAAGLPTTRLDDLVTGRWRKLVWNIPYNGLTVVLDADTHELMADPGTRVLIEQVMAEVIAAAGACGHPIDADFTATMLRTTDDMRPYLPSMKLDLDAGRPLEVDAIYAAPIAAAAAAGFDMVLTRALHAQLQFLDRRNRR